MKAFGASIAFSARIHPTARIEQPWNLNIEENAAIGDSAILYALGEIHVGACSTVSQRAHLCAGTHDYNKPEMPLVRRTVHIGRDAWIAAEAFVGPGVNVGEGAVLGARGVTMRSLDAWTVYAGNPAMQVKNREPLRHCSRDGETD